MCTNTHSNMNIVCSSSLLSVIVCMFASALVLAKRQKGHHALPQLQRILQFKRKYCHHATWPTMYARTFPYQSRCSQCCTMSIIPRHLTLHATNHPANLLARIIDVLIVPKVVKLQRRFICVLFPFSFCSATVAAFIPLQLSHPLFFVQHQQSILFYMNEDLKAGLLFVNASTNSN